MPAGTAEHPADPTGKQVTCRGQRKKEQSSLMSTDTRWANRQASHMRGRGGIGIYLDEHGRKAFRPQLLMHAQEVDVDHIHERALHVHAGRHSRDEGHQLPAGFHADPQMPVWTKRRRLQRPAQKLRGVIEPAV